MRLLIIEDETFISNPLKKALEKESFAVDTAFDGIQGLNLALINKYDCLILDLNLPSMDGLEIAKKLRSEKKSTPILMLTARNSRENILEGFESGTDDYLAKPFDFQELLLRVRALIRRNGTNQEEIIEIDNLSVNLSKNLIKIDNQEIVLNNKEYGILEYLLRHRGKIISQEELLEHVWDREVDMFSQTVRTNVKTLRKKVDKDKKIIHTIIGKGYVIR